MAKSKSKRAPARLRAAKRHARKAARARAAKPSKRARKMSRPRATSARRAAKRGTTRKGAAKTARKATAPKKKAARKAPTPRRAASAKKPAAKKAATARRGGVKAPARRAPTLDRERRTVAETEQAFSPPSSLDLDRSPSAARSGRAELIDRIHEHTSTGPALTAGDIDADWESAESVGDEAPGGDNPTPDQDVVDDIGRALGVEYDDDEELRGGEEIVERDRKRWELDPASSDDFDDKD